MDLTNDGLNLKRNVVVKLVQEDTKYNCLALLVDHVKRIVETHPAPYTLMVSGGIDSQAMVFVWHLANVDFKVCHVNYMGFNAHDFDECQEVCDALGIEVEVKYFDVISFLENRMQEYARTYQCSSPQICTHMALSELVEGTVVFAGNLPTKDFLAVDNTIYGLQRYATITSRPLIPFFLMSSQQASKTSIALSKHGEEGINLYEYKCNHYRLLGFPIVPQTAKYTGFEKLKEYYDNYPERVTRLDKIRHSHLPSKRVFDQLFRNKYLVELKNHYIPSYTINEDKE